MSTGTSRRVNRTALKAEADRLFSRAIRKRDKVCQARGYQFDCSYVLQCAHIIRRRYLATRWSMDGAVALCGAHHIYFTHNDLQWVDWVVERVGESKYQKLRERAKAGFMGSPDYEAIIEELS